MDYFDHVYCIHKPDEQRREAIEKEFKKVGIANVEYVYANRPRSIGGEPFHMSNMRRCPSAEFAVNLSHIKAVRHAIRDGARRPLFLEDDVVFRDDANQILTAALEALPDDWDVLYMGGHPCEKVKKVSDNLVKIGRFSFAESYAINEPMLGAFDDFWLDNIGQHQAMYDFILSRFAQNSGYCVYPVLTHQPIGGYSHISKGKEDKSDLVTRGWLNNLT